ncbi:choline/ethanolamine kinase-like [Oppia nitens]|uniref:choline/ethanolamine kinase-like n=1 Tax=Oppia nitens TaxID=1686743 RepID=UPI0023DAE487|nr:choline/ethanolamine kinase-like [Oppia nitens]
MDNNSEANVSNETQNNKIINNTSDCKDINEIDFEKIELINGETPHDIKHRCLKLCQQYLAGNWLQQTVDTIKVKRLTGGLTNQLYYCGIDKQSTDDLQETPNEVAIRLNPSKDTLISDSDKNKWLSEVVVSLMVSQNKLGPKIYGIFDCGQIQAFYKQRPFKVNEQNDPKLVTELFEKLARVHAMDVPIKKSEWFLNELYKFYDKSTKKTELFALLNKSDIFAKNNLKDEINWIRDIIQKSDSPLVFTHNDFRSNNIMVLENSIPETGQQIVLCDFDSSGYGYRGQDFGAIMSEWGRTPNDVKKPHYFPDDSILRSIFDIYVKETERLFGKEYCEAKRVTIDEIIKETKVYMLYYRLFVVVYYMGTDSKAAFFAMTNTVMVQRVEIAYNNYFRFKEQFIQQYLV